MTSSRTRRTLGALAIAGLAVVAVVVAVAGTFLHRWRSPLGLILAVGGAVAVAVIARACARTRAGSAVVALAWLAPTLALAQTAPGEDVVITGGEAGLVLLFGGSFGHAVALGLGVSSDRSTPVT